LKAIHCTKYGGPDVLVVKDIPIPRPQDHEILVKIFASSATKADSMMRQGTPRWARVFLGLTKPKYSITGTGYAGVVTEIGKNITQFNVGDKVFGESGMKMSTNAEYVTVASSSLIVRKPDSLSDEAAASLCDGPISSLNFLKHVAELKSGQRVLINGASGSLGTAAVQIARALGAHVTGVCSIGNVELVKSLGAHEVIDYTKSKFTNTGNTWDVIYDTVGNSSFSECKRVLTESGAFVSPVLSLSLVVQMMLHGKSKNKKARFSATGLKPVPELHAMMNELLALIAENQVSVVIDKRYPLEDAAQAHAYIDGGHKKGSIVLIPGA
jgi:NADPH:quinone reductase-like Zn-dependent oxidoreductase